MGAHFTLLLHLPRSPQAGWWYNDGDGSINNALSQVKGESAMNLGPTELIIILVIILIVFGAGRLPQVFSSLGKGVKEFRDASEGTSSTPPPNTGEKPEVPATPNTAPPTP